MQKRDLAVFVLAHREGALLHPTLRSVEQSAAFARANGADLETHLILDAVDLETRSVAGHHQSKLRIIETEFGDRAKSFDEARLATSARMVAVVEAGKLVSRNWFLSVIALSRGDVRPAVYHPHFSVLRCDQQVLVEHLSSDDDAFDPAMLLMNCPWSSVVTIHAEVLNQHAINEAKWESGLWHWFQEICAERIAVRTVAETLAFSRTHEETNNGQDRGVLATKLFESKCFPRIDSPRMTERDAPGEEQEETTPHEKTTLVSAFKHMLSSMFPHRLRHGLRAATVDYPWNPVQKAESPAPITMPSVLWDEWKAIHPIDPDYFPNHDLYHTRTLASIDSDRAEKLASTIGEILEQCPRSMSHLLVVPWLKAGGSDRTAINYARALVEMNRGYKVVVLATENCESPWSVRLPSEVTFVEFGKIAAELTADEQMMLLARLVVQRPPRVLHNLNSNLAYHLLIRFGELLTKSSNLYCHVFCDDLSHDGQFIGYNRRYLPKCINALTALIGDNATELDRLRETYLFEPAKLIPHYQPIETVDLKRPVRDSDKGTFHVLWAGRLDRQKRPDLLQKIADRCLEMPIHFHVYGSALFREKMAIPEGKNITYHGPFDGFKSIPKDDYKAFLYTSQWDGLPNILSEALAEGLPIVASHVGGVHELIRDHQTGLLVDPFDDPDLYVDALLQLQSDSELSTLLVKNAQELLRTQHSWEAFTRSIDSTPGYTENRVKNAAA